MRPKCLEARRQAIRIGSVSMRIYALAVWKGVRAVGIGRAEDEHAISQLPAPNPGRNAMVPGSPKGYSCEVGGFSTLTHSGRTELPT